MIHGLDAINGLFELLGAVVTWRNFFRLRNDRSISGVNWTSMAFFAAWGVWNLVYYSGLSQWLSFIAGAFLTAGNIAWVVLALRLDRAHRGNV